MSAPTQIGWFSGIFRSNTEKKIKEKRSKKKASKNGNDDSSSNDAKDSSLDGNSELAATPEPTVDEEGYTIPSARRLDNHKDLDNFYSSSDDESGSEDNEKRIHVVIRPPDSDELKRGPSIAELKGISFPSPYQSSRRQNSTARNGLSTMEGLLKKSTSEVLHRSSTTTNDSLEFLRPMPATNGLSRTAARNSVNSTGSNSNGNYAANYGFLEHNGSGTATSRAGDANNSSSASEDRYAALSSLFETESQRTDSVTTTPSTTFDSSNFSNSFNFSSNPLKPLSLSKSVSSLAMTQDTPMSIPRPPSKPRSHFQSLSKQSSLSRAESYGSLSSTDFRMTPLSISSSRGSSPLTRGLSDNIPIAVAFQESISARFKGTDETRCQSQVFGSVKFAFPSTIVQALSNNSAPSEFSFKLSNASRIQKLIPNKDFVTITDGDSGSASYTFTIDVASLGSHLQKLLVQLPNARYYNVDVIKYQLNSLGAKSCPIQVVSHWKCESNTTFLKVEYKYNASAVSSMQAIKNTTFTVNIEANVTGVQGKPNPMWNSSTKQASWKFDSISLNSSDNGLGSLRAKFDIADGPSRPSPVIVQFSCNDATLSGLQFEMSSMGYRTTMIKRMIVSGKYSSEADATINYA